MLQPGLLFGCCFCFELHLHAHTTRLRRPPPPLSESSPFSPSSCFLFHLYRTSVLLSLSLLPSFQTFCSISFLPLPPLLPLPPPSSLCSVLPCFPSSSSEPLEEHHVAQLLRRFSTDLSLGRQLSLDGALAHHLHQCSYHLRLFRNWLISGQDPLEYFHGQPLPGPSPSIPQLSRSVQPLAHGLVGLCLLCA